MAGLFGTSGIRGVYGKTVSPALAMRVGNAAASKGGKFIIARDARATSPALSEALAAGAMYAGASVIDIGLSPTPLLAYATAREKCAGAMITASHNPPEYNGIKLFSCGMEFTRGQEAAVEAAIEGNGNAAGRGTAPWNAVQWNEAGQKESKDYSQEFIHFLLTQADTPSIAGKKPRVLVDAGNAAASKVAPALLRAAGCEVVELYCNEPGKFARDLEPKSGTLQEAAKLVVSKKCDLGVAFDGDGDRAIGIDELGRVLGLDAQLSIFCAHFLKKRKGTVVSTVEASLCVKETVEKAGGKLAITPVGSLHVARQVKEARAVFGGEPCGEYVFPSSTPCADGLLAALTLAEIFCTSGKLSALSDAVRTYPMERRKYRCEGKDKEKAMAALQQSLKFEGAKLSVVDGLRYDFSDGWLLVRPSGTEPAMRITCEFREKKKLDETMAIAEKAVLAAIA
ncbi:MAG: hypothetical protein WC263_02330 [Candidatus Micrarchaeia archaeon]|jgi:phosphoglucosamine mutase